MLTARRRTAARDPAVPGSRPAIAPLVAFFVAAFVLSWSWWIPLAMSGQAVRRGHAWPTHLPGLAGPMIAALLVLALVEGRAGVRAWLASMVRWPRSWRWRTASVAPLGLLALGVAVLAITGRLPPARAFVTFSGTAATVPALMLAVVVGAFGEEAGWRGYALPRLEARFGPLKGTLVLSAAWALWHAPLFFVLASYGDFSPLVVPGFFIGLTAGAIVLTALYNHTGSILVVALWHASYNLAAATAAAGGTVAAIATAGVIFWAVSIVQRERAGQPALGRLRALR